MKRYNLNELMWLITMLNHEPDLNEPYPPEDDVLGREIYARNLVAQSALDQRLLAQAD